MPTHEETAAFLRDYRRLTHVQRTRLAEAQSAFIEDLRAMEAGQRTWFRPGLVRKLTNAPGQFELRWASNGRATFSLGAEQRSGRLHIQWRRCGTHDILP